MCPCRSVHVKLYYAVSNKFSICGYSCVLSTHALPQVFADFPLHRPIACTCSPTAIPSLSPFSLCISHCDHPLSSFPSSRYSSPSNCKLQTVSATLQQWSGTSCWPWSMSWRTMRSTKGSLWNRPRSSGFSTGWKIAKFRRSTVTRLAWPKRLQGVCKKNLHINVSGF